MNVVQCSKCGAQLGYGFDATGWITVDTHYCRPKQCPTCNSPETHRHPTNDFGESGPICPDQWHSAAEGKSAAQGETK